MKYACLIVPVFGKYNFQHDKFSLPDDDEEEARARAIRMILGAGKSLAV